MQNMEKENGETTQEKEKQERLCLNQLREDMKKQSNKCSENCRYVIVAIFAALWAFLQSEEIPIFRLALSAIMFVCVMFMLTNMWRYYRATKKVRNLYQYSNLLDDNYIIYKMTELSDRTHSLQSIEVLICTLVVLLLIAYVVLRYMIYM